jgi:hypothetical protein
LLLFFSIILRLTETAVTSAMMNNLVQHPAARPLGKEHIPTYPPGFIAIRIVQLVLAVIILGLTAYGLFFSRCARNATLD